MNLVAVFLSAILVAGLGSCNKAHAQSGTSPNLVNPTVGNTQFTMTGANNYTGSGGGFSGGSTPGYNAATNTLYFGYTTSTVAYTYAFNQALQNSGMTITGYNYSWDYLNQNPYNGTLAAKLNFASTSGTSLYTKTWALGATTDWTTVSGTETFSSPGLLASNIANFSLSFTGKDARFWAGYYGPQVKNTSLTLNYTFDQCSSNPLSSPSCPGYAAAYQSQQCTANPLYDSSCAGYAVAYQTQQCNINPLYSPSCSGYASAYLNQQCGINPLYSTTCSGYDTAYLNQQCSQNALYSTRCSGYDQAYQSQQCSLNPLYATTCTGYANAYLNQQCGINPLYSTTCAGYAAAYKTQQCSLNALYATDCPGYTVAYHDQQCSINPLYMNDCSGYAAAYKNQQCTANPLYATDCSGYATAYFDQQCKLNGLYDQKCPNYSTAYATKMVLEQQGTASIVATAGTVAAMAPQPVATVDTSTGTVSTTPSTTGSAVVDKALPPPATSANSAAAPAAPVQLVQQPPAPQQQPQQDKKPDGPKPEGGPQGQPPQGGPQGGDKPAPPTPRQQLAERRAEAAKKDAIEKGKNLANEMGKAADMEAQKQVQNVVIQAMGFTPGFDSYGKTFMPDAVGYRPFTVYNNQVTVDNRRLGRGLFGPTDRLHNEMVDSQYKGE